MRQDKDSIYGMIRTYYMDIGQLNDVGLYQETLQNLSLFRQTKTAVLRHDLDKKRSVAAGAALDYALAQYGLREREMEYRMGAHGKPYLKYHPGIFFALSHSGDYAICSIGDKEMGNDIEAVKEGRRRVADRFFTEEERKWMYEAAEEQELDRRLFRLWTVKESFLKATGRGMSLPLTDFSVQMETEHGRIRVRQTVEAKYFHMEEYTQIEGYCVAVCGRECREMQKELIAVRL